jgi:hypothetical protein
MTSARTSIVPLVVVAAVFAIYGCVGSGSGSNTTGQFSGGAGSPSAGFAGSSAGAAGFVQSTGTAGAGDAAGGGGSGQMMGAGAAGGGGGAGATGTSTGTAGGTGATGDAGCAAGAVADAGATGDAGAATGDAGCAPGAGGVDPITKIVAAGTGCGKPAPAAYTPGKISAMQTIMTMGTKDPNCADSKCGAWTDTRQFFVTLPAGYDMNKPYPILWQGPGCGGRGNNQYLLAPAFYPTVIIVGISPSAYWQAYHATNPNQGCFDDKEGDDSVDWPFYETLYDQLASTICFDRNRVFAGGNSSAGWWSNEIGCKYAGDPMRPMRAISPNTGGLPTDPRYAPTCTTKPMAGFWSHEIGDTTNPFTGTIVAMNRALVVNGCTPTGVTYMTATFDPFPIGGNVPDGTCKKFRGCPDLYPLVICPLLGNSHGGHDNIVDPGWPIFYSMFSTGAFVTQ